MLGSAANPVVRTLSQFGSHRLLGLAANLVVQTLSQFDSHRLLVSAANPVERTLLQFDITDQALTSSKDLQFYITYWVADASTQQCVMIGWWDMKG